MSKMKRYKSIFQEQVKKCGTCSYYKNGQCEITEKVVAAHSQAEYDEWVANPDMVNNCAYYAEGEEYY